MFRRFEKIDGQAVENIKIIAEGEDGSLWSGTMTGLSRLQKTNVQSRDTVANSGDKSFLAIRHKLVSVLLIPLATWCNHCLDKQLSAHLPTNL
jgi:ligand-binding sensor domain-containing protein